MSSPPPSILVLDDHQDTLDLFVMVLSQRGYEVLAVSSVKQALKLTNEKRFDLLVFDSRLSDGSGIDLCKHIRETDQLTPILFCSGLAYEKNKQEALNAGAQAYLVKPVSISLICETVASLLATSERQAASLLKGGQRRDSGELAAPAG
ncbi:MAG: response regulator [Pyrinomonadaceae bacterium]|nr:response regulator [Pyrinomonadaceae bacterium]